MKNLIQRLYRLIFKRKIEEQYISRMDFWGKFTTDQEDSTNSKPKKYTIEKIEKDFSEFNKKYSSKNKSIWK